MRACQKADPLLFGIGGITPCPLQVLGRAGAGTVSSAEIVKNVSIEAGNPVDSCKSFRAQRICALKKPRGAKKL
jgi:hypothetical protein